MNPSAGLESVNPSSSVDLIKGSTSSGLRGCFLVLTDLLRRPSLAYAASALLITYLGKIHWYLDTLTLNSGMKMGFLAFFVQDLVFWAVIISVVWLAENAFAHRAVKVATTLSTGLLTLFFTINVVWLQKTGFQLTRAVIDIALAGFEKVSAIVEYEMGITELLIVAAAMTLPLLLAFIFHEKWIEMHPDLQRYRYTLLFPVLLLGLAVLGFQQGRNPDLVGWRRLADNALLDVVRSLGAREQYSALPRTPEPLTAGDITPDHSGTRPNVIVVLLESTAFRATSLSSSSLNTTPFLASMAAEGLEVESMRVVMPHSTKTLHSTLCGTPPALQQEIVETADNYSRLCLPHIFNQAGYRTTFMQASVAEFEDLARLADRMGFSEFYDWNNIQPKPELVGYLGADDQVLEEAATRWVAGQKEPYFLTLFTSATHHPYIPPKRIISTQKELAKLEDPVARYLHLVRDTDQIMERLFATLERRGQLENTVVVMMGDHGEGFGENGGYQHDNIFTDIGLRIPFVIKAPGRISPGTRVSENRTVLDVAPTILELAGLAELSERFEGTSLLQPLPRDERHYFACFFNYSCVGFMEGDRKVVYLPSMESWLTLDIAADPREVSPQLDAGDLSNDIDAMSLWYHGNRYDPNDFRWTSRELWGGLWKCDDGYGTCKFKNRKAQSARN